MTDKGSRPTSLLICAMASFVAAALWPELAHPRSAFKLATWNLEHLAERNGEGCRSRTDRDYAELRSYADKLDADVIAFQEVENRKAAERVFDPERYDILMSHWPNEFVARPCWGSTSQSLRRQEVGFAIRKGVKFTRNHDYRTLGIGLPHQRRTFDVTILSPVHVRLFAVHLKSGCPAGRTGNACDALFAQLPQLEEWIDARAEEPVPFVVLGDFNRRLARLGDPFWHEIDDGDPSGADLTLASGTLGAKCRAQFPEFIDNIVLGKRAAARLVQGSFEEFSYGVSEAEYPSDHCPVSMQLRTM